MSKPKSYHRILRAMRSWRDDRELRYRQWGRQDVCG